MRSVGDPAGDGIAGPAAAEGPWGVGVDIGAVRTTGVLVDGAGRVEVCHELPTTAGPAPVLEQILAAVVAPSRRGHVARVVVSTSALTVGLDSPHSLDRVAVLRIGAPATVAVPPLTGWPPDLAAAVRGPVEIVGGGHLHDGTPLAPLDAAAVRAFALRCAGRASAVAVSAAGGYLDPSHEERATGILAEVLGAAVPVVTSHDLGGAGLLERENTAVFDAALAGAASGCTGALAAAVSAAGLEADLYLMGGAGTVLPASRVAHHALHTVGAAHGSARSGIARLLGSPTLVVVDANGTELLVSAQVDGLPVESGLFTEVRGVRTALHAVRVLPAGRPSGGVGGGRWARVRAAVHQAGAGLGPITVALVGPAGRSPAGAGDGWVRHPDAAVAAAYGAATGEASATVDRLFWFADGSREECVRAARRAARDGAVRAGADPRRVRVGSVREMMLTYVPMPCVRLRVTATGPIVAPATVAGRYR